MKDKDIGFGIIGCGTISSWHADAICEIEGAVLIGATDVHEQSRKAFAKKYATRDFKSIESLLSNPEIEVVCICTPSGLHAELAIQAANAGKHVVIEKPMATTVQQCNDVIKACKTNKVKMAVISQLRFADAICKIKEAVDNNRLGKIVLGDIYMKYYRSQEYYDKGGWRGTWEMDGGGALMNQGIHGIDLLQYIMGPVKSVFAHTRTLARNIDVEDTASALIEFKSGALGVIQGTTSVYPGSARRLEINGTKGTIVLVEDTIEQWDILGETAEDIKIGKSDIESASNPKAFGVEGHIRQISDMVSAIKSDVKPLVDQYEGRKAIEIIRAIYKSSQEGKKIDL